MAGGTEKRIKRHQLFISSNLETPSATISSKAHVARMRLVPGPAVSQILHHLTRKQCHSFIDAMIEALVSVSSDSINSPSERFIHQPLRTTFITKENNLSLFMPFSNTAKTGIKIVTVARTGGIWGAINIFSSDGRLLGLLNAAEITAFRTALATMTLFVRCSSLKKENIVIMGSGKQAEWHARLALQLVPEQVRKITFINRGSRRLHEMEREVITPLRCAYPNIIMTSFAKEDNPEYGDRLRSEIAASNVIFSCTPATEPNFPYSYLQQSPRQRFISLIGSYKPHMQEIDSETLLSGDGKIYVDSKEACLEESGELIQANVAEDQLIEIGELYHGYGNSEAVQVPDCGNIIFKCVGMGIMDLAVALKILNIAHEQGLGMEVDGF
jgi:ornithine cyclodeaminase/alanine dehydrogenase-like protein (mu-crystallin family)